MTAPGIVCCPTLARTRRVRPRVTPCLDLPEDLCLIERRGCGGGALVAYAYSDATAPGITLLRWHRLADAATGSLLSCRIGAAFAAVAALDELRLYYGGTLIGSVTADFPGPWSLDVAFTRVPGIDSVLAVIQRSANPPAGVDAIAYGVGCAYACA